MSILETYLNTFRNEEGERKFRKLANAIETEKRFNTFISQTRVNRQLPNPDYFYEVVMASVFLSFAGKPKLTTMALLMLQRWDNEVNSGQSLMTSKEVESFADELILSGNQLGI